MIFCTKIFHVKEYKKRNESVWNISKQGQDFDHEVESPKDYVVFGLNDKCLANNDRIKSNINSTQIQSSFLKFTAVQKLKLIISMPFLYPYYLENIKIRNVIVEIFNLRIKCL